jgi:hypothetical protein
MGRGGQRNGAGRKSGWKNSETQTIRVPKIFAAQILEYARKLDSESGIPEPQPGILQIEDEVLPQIDFETVSDNSNLLDVVPGQISLFDVIDSVSESEMFPLRGDQLAERFGVNRGVPSQAKGRFKSNPEKFVAWTKEHDPDGIGWEFDSITKLYHPIEDSSDDF